MTHELIGHKVVIGRVYAHIERVYDEGLHVTYPLLRTTGIHVGQFRYQPLCKGVQGRTSRHSSFSNDPAAVERNHAGLVRSNSNGFPELKPPARYVMCETCWTRYATDREKAAA